MKQADRSVQDVLTAFGLSTQVVELAASTRTAAEAACAIGCHVEQIAKSLVFRAATADGAVLVLASGASRVDGSRIADLVGGSVHPADAGFVRERTGFSIGGVPPTGHRETLPTLLDRRLLALDKLWAAAGTPHAVFRIAPALLARIAAARVVRVC